MRCGAIAAREHHPPAARYNAAGENPIWTAKAGSAGYRGIRSAGPVGCSAGVDAGHRPRLDGCQPPFVRPIT